MNMTPLEAGAQVAQMHDKATHFLAVANQAQIDGDRALEQIARWRYWHHEQQARCLTSALCELFAGTLLAGDGGDTPV